MSTGTLTLTRQAAAFLPYGRHRVSDDDIAAVVRVLRSDRLTQGPAVPAFELELARFLGVGHVVACSSGTAALHLAMLAAGVGPGDLAVTTPITFLASANCARYVGADVRFVDVDAATGLMDPDALANLLAADRSHKIKVVLPVHFAGQPVDLERIHALAGSHGALVVDDACHALGAEYVHNGKRTHVGGSPHAEMTVFSFHPVKHVAMGEGGAIATADHKLAEQLCHLRSHGIRRGEFSNPGLALSPNGEPNPWYYEMHQLGFNYRLADLQAALGTGQLSRLQWSLDQRSRISKTYERLLTAHFGPEEVIPLRTLPRRTHAYHLYVVLIDFQRFGVPRATVMNGLRDRGIGTQVHYVPIHLQPYYQQRYGMNVGDFPNAERYYARALSLPMYPDLTPDDCQRVVLSLKDALTGGP